MDKMLAMENLLYSGLNHQDPGICSQAWGWFQFSSESLGRDDYETLLTFKNNTNFEGDMALQNKG